MLMPIAAPVFYLVGSWLLYVAPSLIGWIDLYGIDHFWDGITGLSSSWWRRNFSSWEYLLALMALISLAAGILALVLHLLLPRSRHDQE
jgi:hypothetical protein